MDAARWERICSIFEAARTLTGAAREAVVASASDVADDVRELLAEHDQEGGPLAEPDGDLTAGAAVGPYRIAGVLGRGGMATVYRATGPDGPVALKQLLPALQQEAAVRERFRREAALGARIQHPSVVRTFGLEGDDALVMELLAGRTLADELSACGPLPEAECRRIGARIAEGLAAIHAAGAVHRDLKPSNVMLLEDGSLKLMDLGIAFSLDDLLRLSKTGEFVGTARYSAPEQLVPTKAEIDARTDLYALGLVLYELAAGQHPIPPGGLLTTLRAQLDLVPEPLRRIRTDVSEELETLVQALLAKRPDDRPQNVEEVVAALSRSSA